MRTHHICLIFILLLEGFSRFSCFADEVKTIELTLLSTTDLHCYALSYDYYKDCEDPKVGLERTATLIQQARQEFSHTLLFDSGDTIQGNPLSDYKAWVKPVQLGEVHPIYKVMNYLKYDAAAIGNHEFNYGLDFLLQVTQKANFPNVLANVYSQKKQKPLFPPYVILERTYEGMPLKIGVIGFTPPQIMTWDAEHLKKKVYVEDIIQSAKRYVPEMKQKGADIVVALAHCGLNLSSYQTNMENPCYYLSQVPGIDVILFGHSHGKFPGDSRFNNLFKRGIDNQKGLINQRAGVMAGFYGNTLGLVHLKLETSAGKWRVKKVWSELRSILKEGKPIAADPKIRPLLLTEHTETINYVNTAISQTKLRISTYFSHVIDSHALQIVNNAQRWHVKKHFLANSSEKLPLLSCIAPFKTNFRGTGYTDILPGRVAIKHIADLYLYPNTLHVVKVNGATIKSWLETSSQIYNRINPEKETDQYLLSRHFPSFNHDVFDGITYQIDLSKPAGQRIIALKYKEQVVKPEAEFLVATNNYRAGGGGNFPGLNGNQTVYKSPGTVRDILIDYFKTQKVITKADAADNNWSFVPMKTKGRVLLHSGKGIQSILQERGINSIVLVEEREKDALYQINLK